MIPKQRLRAIEASWSQWMDEAWSHMKTDVWKMKPMDVKCEAWSMKREAWIGQEDVWTVKWSMYGSWNYVKHEMSKYGFWLWYIIVFVFICICINCKREDLTWQQHTDMTTAHRHHIPSIHSIHSIPFHSIPSWASHSENRHQHYLSQTAFAIPP